ncbi:MAG: hypothetical protein IJS90_07900 [Clostridia bacterium]|nr:hypothetical protein [Clostridia bacterium]
MTNYRWMKTDTASIMFSSLTSKKWGRTFRFTACLDEDVDPAVLEKAANDVVPCYPGFCSSLHRGFFWTYQTVSELPPEITPEGKRPLQPITSMYGDLPNFRLVYSGNEVSLESSHCQGDGKGIMRVFEEILMRYTVLLRGVNTPYSPFLPAQITASNAFDDYYDKNGKKDQPALPKAFHFPETFEKNYLRLNFAETWEGDIIAMAHKRNMTVTEFMCAVLILGVIKSADSPINEPVTIAVPVNLRRFFKSESLRNFTIQSYVTFYPDGKRDYTLDDICEATRGELKRSLTPDVLSRSVNKYGALKTNPVLRIVPYAIKRPVLVKIQRKSHASVTTIFTNLGERQPPDGLTAHLRKLRFVNGDTSRYGLAATCSCISFNGILSLCFSQTNRDSRWFDECVAILRENGAEVNTDFVEGSDSPRIPEGAKKKTPFSAEKLKAYFNT